MKRAPELIEEATERGVDALSAEASRLSRRIAPMLRGYHPAVQSAALADLVSMHLAGIFILNDEDATTHMRETMLDHFVELVKSLIPGNEETVTKPMLKEALDRGE